MTEGDRKGLRRVAIVGRPNVGKSTLLNRMVGSRVAIVEPTAGVTRDRVMVEVRLRLDSGTRRVELVDTGGIGVVDRDDLGPLVESQVFAALESADLILFLVDVRDGMTPLDQEVARRLRGAPQPVILVANKAEGEALSVEAEVFRALGFEEGPYPISAQNGEGLGPLVRRMGELLPPPVEGEGEGSTPAVMKLAVIGQRNVGKSTLINNLAGEERMIVSEIPGTTRDSVDVVFERDGQRFIAIDTAGVRRKSRIADAIEFYSDARSHRTIRRADVVLLLMDAGREVAAIDKRLARYVVDHHKPVVLALNKWDLIEDHGRGEFVKYLRAELPGLDWAPVHVLSAKSGQGVGGLVGLAQELFERAHVRAGTAELNRVLERATETVSPGSKGQRVRILYGTQADSAPPTFVLFVNDKRLVGKDYLRFLERRFRRELGFENIPVHIVLRDRGERRSGGTTAIPRGGPR